jgi:hypothetical protein
MVSNWIPKTVPHVELQNAFSKLGHGGASAAPIEVQISWYSYAKL